MKNKPITYLFAVLLWLRATVAGAQTPVDTAAFGKLTTIFPKGEPAPASNFTGAVFLYMLYPSENTFHCSVGSVTFAPGARSYWHTHPSGQILLVTSGVCYYQEKGKPIQIFRKGEVVKCPPNVMHWYGAAPDSAMSHISIISNTEKGIVNWLNPVTDKEYQTIN